MSMTSIIQCNSVQDYGNGKPVRALAYDSDGKQRVSRYLTPSSRDGYRTAPFKVARGSRSTMIAMLAAMSLSRDA